MKQKSYKTVIKTIIVSAALIMATSNLSTCIIITPNQPKPAPPKNQPESNKRNPKAVDTQDEKPPKK